MLLPRSAQPAAALRACGGRPATALPPFCQKTQEIHVSTTLQPETQVHDEIESETAEEIENEEEDEAQRESADQTSSETKIDEQPLSQSRQEIVDKLKETLPTPTPQDQEGIIRGLASTLSVAGTLLLVIAKTAEDQLLVTIQPQCGKEDAPGTAVPLQVVGTPEEIDTKLIAELSHFVPARVIATASAKEVADLTAKAAQAQREEASKKAAETRKSYSAPKTGALTVKVTPDDATISVKDSNDKEQTPAAANGKTRWLPYGKYTVTASKEGYESQTIPVTISSTAQKPEITLTVAAPSLFGN